MNQHASVPQKWSRLKAGLLVGLIFSVSTAPPSLAEEQETWSPAFLSALEVWQSRYADMSLAEYVAADHPDLMAEWSHQASNALGGSILAFYQDSDPELVQVYEASYLEPDADGNVTGDDPSFVDFLIHGTDDATFASLEREVEKRKGAGLSAFVAGIDGEILASYDQLPKDQPVYAQPLREFIADNFQNPALDIEAQVYEAQSVLSTCSCSVLAAAVGPNDDTSSIYRLYKPNGALKEERSTWLTKHGAARRLFTDRYILNGLNELNHSTNVSSAAIQFTMSCVQNVNGSLVQCAGGQGCSAQIKLDARYDSNMWVKNEATRAFPAQSIGSSVMTMDIFTLVANPGPLRVVLAEKGLALERNFGTSISAQSILEGVKSAYNIYSAVNGALSTDPDFGALLGSLNDEDINNVLAVATFNGSRGETTLGFASSYTNSGGAPLILANGATHKVEMTSYSKAKSRGWGHTSRGRSLTASNYFLVGVATNYACTSATGPASPKIAWSYGSVYQAPYSGSGMRANVDAFILGTTGLSISTAASNGTN